MATRQTRFEENMLQDKIELLDVGLLDDKNRLKVIDHWLGVMNWPNGWHYDLDIIWLLRHIEKLQLPRGATLVDAGAGLGMTQFILAACGYNVISLDFTQRQVPRFAKGIFTIENIDRDLGSYTHEYMEFMKYGPEQRTPEKKQRTLGAIFQKACDPKRFKLNAYVALDRLRQIFNFSYVRERMKDHQGFGKITFLRGTFNSIPLPDGAADALVSVSAFEHNTYADMPASIQEFLRVVKPHAPLIITTSASEKADWYFKPPKAWNFSRQTLAAWFQIADDKVRFNYREVFEHITQSRVLEQRLSPFYKLTGENGLPYGNLKQIQYVPVGIIKIKRPA